MISALLLGLMLFRTGPQADAKPVIDNDRVAVWNMTPEGAASRNTEQFDAVAVSFSGKAIFVPKGTSLHLGGHSIIIDLKDHPLPPIPNNSGYPLAFPRPGSKKLVENERVIVWDYVWKPGVPTPMHFHDKDAVVLFLEDGDLKSTTPDGKEVVTAYTAGEVRFGARNRSHFEALVRGTQHAIITELK